MNAVVTGATGFLGRTLVRLLREDGLHVTCLIRPGSDSTLLRQAVGDSLWGGVEVRTVDLMNTEACRDAVIGCSIVYHLAAGLAGSTSTLFLNSVIPTRRLLAASSAAGVPRFVHVSSLGIYGTQALKRNDVLDETTPVDPHPHLRDPYTFSKITQERTVWEAYRRTGLPVVVVRPGVIIGPGRGVLSSRIGLQLGPVMFRMGGDQHLPYTYVENCAAAIRNAGLSDRIQGEAFNVVDDDLPTASQLLRMCRRSGHRVRTLWIPRSLIRPLAGSYEWYHRWSRGQLPGVITRYRTEAMWKPLRFANDKAKAHLNWRPLVSFDEAVHRSLSQQTT